MFFYYLFLLLLVNSYIEKWGRTIHLVIFKTRLWWQNNVIICAIIDASLLVMQKPQSSPLRGKNKIQT